ncbi:MAG: hypothetical protein LBF88_14490 [Planctomycetaceae bacterium]|jgi:NRPS condensation-like uncharacterized protein|nr:hypothetical protein [Planctomycetaceae bacterium]
MNENDSFFLTPFEEYMLVDSHPVYPMSCFMQLRFQGRFDIDLLSQSLQKILKIHPLLCSVIEKTRSGRFCWKLSVETIEIRRGTFHAEGINLEREPALKITLDEQADHQSDLWFEVHHSASDAAGMQRFLEDLLIEYSVQKCFLNPKILLLREPVHPLLLRNRGRYGQNFGTFLWNLPRQIWGLERARTFLFNRIIPLIPQKPDLSKNLPPTNYPALFRRKLNDEETKQVQILAKLSKVTINDFLLRSLFLAMNDWRQHEKIPEQAGWLRIAIPTNLRTLNDCLMPAANIVSMVFLDRKPNRLQNNHSFLQGICREMRHIKKCNLGLALIYGLTVYRKLFGSYEKMINQNRCWTTVTISNLGLLFHQTPFPLHNGNLRIDKELELTEIHSVPPIRPQTVLGVCAFSYANHLTLDMQYDSELLNPDQAKKLFDLLIKYLLSAPV